MSKFIWKTLGIDPQLSLRKFHLRGMSLTWLNTMSTPRGRANGYA
ncbi:hypothetical protein [Ruegeria sp.]